MRLKIQFIDDWQNTMHHEKFFLMQWPTIISVFVQKLMQINNIEKKIIRKDESMLFSKSETLLRPHNFFLLFLYSCCVVNKPYIYLFPINISNYFSFYFHMDKTILSVWFLFIIFLVLLCISINTFDSFTWSEHSSFPNLIM